MLKLTRTRVDKGRSPPNMVSKRRICIRWNKSWRFVSCIHLFRVVSLRCFFWFWKFLITSNGQWLIINVFCLLRVLSKSSCPRLGKICALPARIYDAEIGVFCWQMKAGCRKLPRFSHGNNHGLICSPKANEQEQINLCFDGPGKTYRSPPQSAAGVLRSARCQEGEGEWYQPSTRQKVLA